MKKLLLGLGLVVGLITIASACSYKITDIHGNEATIKCANGDRYEMVYRSGEWKKKNKMINRASSKTLERVAQKVCGC